MLKNIKKIANPIVFLALSLISMDAYNFKKIPFQYFGFLILFCLAFFLTTKKIKINSLVFYTFFLIIFIPVFFTLRITNNFYFLSTDNIRLFNLISFFAVFLYFFTTFSFESNKSFFVYLEKFILIVSLLSLYIYFAQIYDLPELTRNRSGTNLLGNSLQTTFWPYQHHRLLGTFREPLLFVSFISPLYLLLLKYKSDVSYFIIFISSLCIGLAASDLTLFYFSIILAIYLTMIFFKNFNMNESKFVIKKIILGLTLPILFSFISIVECSVNPKSIDCTQFDISFDNTETLYKSDAYEDIISFDADRRNIVNYFFYEGSNETSLGLYMPLNNFNSYINKNLNIEQYLTNRTLPQFLSTKYLSQNFGTGNYSYLKFTPNFQNLFINFYLTYGSLFLVLIGSIFIISIYFSKNKNNIIYLHFIIFLFFLFPIEELTAFTGLIFGVCYKMIKKELVNDPII